MFAKVNIIVLLILATYDSELTIVTFLLLQAIGLKFYLPEEYFDA